MIQLCLLILVIKDYFTAPDVQQKTQMPTGPWVGILFLEVKNFNSIQFILYSPISQIMNLKIENFHREKREETFRRATEEDQTHQVQWTLWDVESQRLPRESRVNNKRCKLFIHKWREIIGAQCILKRPPAADKPIVAYLRINEHTKIQQKQKSSTFQASVTTFRVFVTHPVRNTGSLVCCCCWETRLLLRPPLRVNTLNNKSFAL